MTPPFIDLVIQPIYKSVNTPNKVDFQKWIETTLVYMHPIKACLFKNKISLTIRIVDFAEIQALNKAYREKDKPTNVLSFPSELPSFLINTLKAQPLGDIIVCAPFIEQEAKAQHKDILSHWAHMIVHSTLHLLGYDHIHPSEALLMESYEQAILNQLQFPDPYSPFERT